MTDNTVKLSAYEQFETATEAENKGVWVQAGTMSFLIARAGGENEAFMKKGSETFKPYQVALESDSMPKELARDLVVGLYADTIVLDWKNVFDRGGVELPYSKENCKKLLGDLPNLFAQIQKESVALSNFKRKNLEAAAGN